MRPPTVQLLNRSALGLAVAVRVYGLLSIGRTPYVDQPLVDAFTYWDQATQMLEGKNPFSEGFYQSPGYPAVLWAVAKLTGGLDYQTVRAFQLVLGLLTTWLLLRLGQKLGEARGAPWLGAVAAVVYSLYPTTLLFELDLLTPAVTAALTVGALALLWERAEGRAGLLRAGGAGVLLGAACVVHPTVLLATGVTVWWADRARGRQAAVALAVGAALSLTPTAGTNLFKWGQVALVSHNAGINFYLGNNPSWRETHFLRPGLGFRQLVLEAEPDQRDTFERDRYWRSRAWKEIGAAPLTWADTLATKALWSVNHTEIPRNEDYRCRTEAGPLAWAGALPVRYGLVFPFAVLGAVALWRAGRARPEARLVVLQWVALQVPMVLFLVADRYRLATWPLVSLAAPVGLWAAIQAVKERPKPAWALALPVVALPWLPIDKVTAFDPSWCAHVAGNLAYGVKDYATAEARYREAVALNPEDLDAWRWLAYALHERGEDREAVEALSKVTAAFPDHYPTLLFMSQLQEKLGDLSAAADYAGLAYKVPGPRTNTGVRYVRLLMRAGREEEARAVVARDKRLQKKGALQDADEAERAPDDAGKGPEEAP